MPGRFISFEGIDGSGKSTQARLLADHLRANGADVLLTREPGGSPGAEEIRRLVLTGDPGRWSAETEILLFTAARRDHLERTIRPALDAGRVVITDRFADSTRAYQGTTRGDLRNMVDTLHSMMIAVEPDLTIVIDMDPKVALARSLGRLAGLEAARAASNAALAAAAASDESSVSANVATVATAVAAAAEAAANSQSIDTAVKMIQAGTMPEDRFETFGDLFQENLRKSFLEIATANPTRCVLIDGNRPPELVAADVAAHVCLP